MVVNESAENYLEKILILSQSRPVVRSVESAEAMGFEESRGRCAVKSLGDKKHITRTR